MNVWLRFVNLQKLQYQIIALNWWKKWIVCFRNQKLSGIKLYTFSKPKGHNHLYGGLWAIEYGLRWEHRGRTRGSKCSQGREDETPRGGTVPENMRWWIILANAFERWKRRFKLVWGNCFVNCYIIYDLDHIRCGFMSITLLWEDDTKWKKRSWSSSPSQGASTWCSHWVSLTYRYKENWTQKW